MKTLHYESSPRIRVEPLRFVLLSRSIALSAAGVAGLIMFGAWLTGGVFFAFLGFLWMYGSGALTLLALSFALADCCSALLATEDRRRHLFRAGISMAVVLLNVPLALVCGHLGQSLG